MKTLITSCGRPDLLKQTIDSFLDNMGRNEIVIHEDSKNLYAIDLSPRCASMFTLVRTGGNGQHSSIEKFLNDPDNRNKYYIHMEDDWLVDNTYPWIRDSIDIMEKNPMIIKVLATNGTPHPCVHDKQLNDFKYGIIEPWQNTDSLWWCGFSWNPGVTRMDLLQKFVPFPKWEQELGLAIHNAGYKVAELKDKVFTHIGHDRSTHHKR